jgi:DME family drug/metabolite transporter
MDSPVVEFEGRPAAVNASMFRLARASKTSGGAAAVLVAAAVWGTVGPAQVLASSPADPGSLGVARLLVGGIALAALSPRLSTWRAALRRDVVGWVLLAALATGVYQVTFMHAVDQLGAALGTTIALGVAPVVTGVCARWWIRERFTAGWLLGTLGAVIGCAVLLNPFGATHISLTGTGIALVSGTCYGVYTVAAKRFLQAGAPPLPAASLTLLIAGVTLSPIMVLQSGHLLDPNSLALIGWLGLVCTAMAYAAFTYGLRRTSAPAAGTLSLAEPLLAAGLGVIVLHEHLSLTAAIGCLMLVFGLVVVTAIDALPSRQTRGVATSCDASPTRVVTPTVRRPARLR